VERRRHASHFASQSASGSPDPAAGMIPNRYTVLESISRGGMAIVFKVIDREEDKIRALKLLPLTGCTPTTVELFRLEFARISSLEHPHILRVYDFGSAGDEALYFVMEYVDGLHFDEALKGEPLDAVVKLSVQICDALSYIHSRGIVHGDIKPANVLVLKGRREDGSSENAGPFVKLTDFGLARMMSEAGIAGGTHAYAAPEVIRGLPVDARADLYSFGAMLYEVVTRARLFTETSEEAVLRAHVLKRPVSPREINPSVSTYLTNVILRLLEKDPRRRYQSARELARVLMHAAGLEAELEILSPQPVALLSAEIVGRDNELSLLKENLTACRADGKGGFFLVTGEAGVGKTRLLEWIRLAASMDNLRVAFVKSGESSASSAGVHLRWSGKDTGVELGGGCQVSSEAESAKDADGSLGTGFTEFSGTDSLFRSIFPRTMDKVEPSVVLIDDIHLGEPELLRSLITNVPFTSVLPLLFFCSCDVEAFEQGSAAARLYSELKSLPGVREHALRRLSMEEILLLASSMLAVEPCDEMRPLAEWLFSRSQGIPMLVEELLTQLASRGCLKRLGERITWHLSEEASILSALGTPELVAKRLGALSRDESELLRAGSISGSTFRTEAVGFILSKPPAEVARLIGGLREKGVIVPGEPGYYVFSHPVARSMVYEGLDAGARSELHRKMALWLEKNEPETGLSELAVHLEESGQNEKALECRMKCLELSVAKSSYSEALQHGRAAVSLARTIGAKEVLALALEFAADSAQKAGRHAEALRLWEERLSLVPAQITDKRVRVNLKIAKLKLKFSRYDEAEERLVEAMKLASGAGFEKDRAEILADMSWVYFKTSRDNEALKSLEEAAQLASERGMEALLARIENRSGLVLSKLGRLEESERRHREAVRLARLSGEGEVVATCLNNLGLLLLKRGRFEEAESVISEACDKAQEAGELIVLCACYNNLGLTRRGLLKLDSALESHLKSMDLRRRCGDLVGSGRTAANVAVIYRLKGEIQFARRFYEEAYRIAKQFDLKHERAMAAGNLAEIEGLKGNSGEAERLYLEALSINRESDDRDGFAFCAAGLGCVFLRNGDLSKALQWAQDALEASSSGSQERVVAEQLLIETLCSLGEIEKAREKLEHLSAHTDKEVRSVGLGILRRMEGLVLEKSGNLKEAIEKYRSSCSVLSQEGDSLERARSLLCLGEALLVYRREATSAELLQSKEELLTEAVSVLEEADQIFERMEAGPERARSMSALLNAYRETSSLPGAMMPKEEADTLRKAAELINSTLPSSVVLDKIMDLALDKTGGERGLIVLTNKESGEIEKVLSRSLEDQTEMDALEISRTVVKRVTRGGQALATPDASVDPELKDIKSVAQLEIRSILCVPLRARNKVIGAVYLDNRSVPGAFGSTHQSFMEGFANLAGMAIENSMLREELEGMNESLSRENLELRKQVASHYRFDQIIGESPQMKKVFGAIEKVASSGATVLIAGASGTGKELVARAIHFNSPRKDKPFIPVNCASIPRELIEGELFGIEDRVATGVSKRIGVFEQADGGSIFLDEIGDMSLDLQSRLLRVLQEREFKRVGGRRSIKVDVRIICATNKNLLQEIARGTFRSDLYYRISGIPIDIPSLKERKGDIPHLVAFFLKKYSALYKRGKPPKISDEITRLLTEGDWEGNVRELENCIERFVVMCTPGEEVPFALLPQELKAKALPLSSVSTLGKTGRRRLKDEIEQVEKQKLMEALIRNNGNRSKVGRELGISEQSVRYKIRKYRINVRQLCRDALT
jgi:transcriptional regulator with GAF, ATPase, and Fis domain/serine/threonine protein kinase/tetratricopeptide (TPR) repeat protein